ncbi:MAG TPA: hypothetical protein VFJ45_12465 [bacterium]|nr:hypothetical protein [bacterium]
MKRLLPIAMLLVGALALVRSAVAAPADTRLTLSGPSAVELGEEIALEARLLTGGGAPIPGAVLELRQVGAVGERGLRQATTDAQGMALLTHREYSVPVLTLRATFAGTSALAPAHADLRVTVNGVRVPPSVAMAHRPGLAIKTALFLLLGTVWLTYLYAASRVARVALDARSPIQGGRVR